MPVLKPTLGMQSISDVVFGLALSIGSVILISKVPTTPTDLAKDLLAFGFSFLIVVIVWTGYRRAVVTLPHETQATVVVNVVLLFVVSVEPFLFWVMVAGGALFGSASADPMLEPVSVAYSLDVGAMILLQSVLNALLLIEEKAAPRKDLAPDVLLRIGHRIWLGSAVGLMFLASALPFFWVPVPGGSVLRVDLWYLGLVLIFVLPRLPTRGTEGSQSSKDGKTGSR